jgi:hypothetical protein
MSEKKNRFKKNKPCQPIINDWTKDSDANFSFIAGHTSGGTPFGLTWDEYAPDQVSLDPSLHQKPEKKKRKSNNI